MHRTVLQYPDDIPEAIGNIEEDTFGISPTGFRCVAKGTLAEPGKQYSFVELLH